MTTITLPTNTLPAGDIGRAFLTAGKAIFTVSNPAGQRYTFKVSKGKARGERPAPYFASFLTGPDNEADYTYLGLVTETFGLKATTASPAHAETTHTPFRVLAFALRVLDGRQALPAGYKIQHEGRCGRCGRTLTVPESIESGLGPECAGKVGLR